MSKQFTQPSAKVGRRMMISVAFGALAFLLVTTLVRASVQIKSDELADSLRSRNRVDSAVIEVARQTSLAHRRLESWLVDTQAREQTGGDFESLWLRLLESSELAADETLALVGPNGTMLAAVGPRADQPDELSSLLRARALTGRTGDDGVRAGMILPEPSVLLGVSVPVASSQATGGHAVPGTTARLALLSGFKVDTKFQGADHVSLSFFPLHGDGLPRELSSVPAKLWRNDGAIDEATRSFRTIDDPSQRPTFLLVGETTSGGIGWLSSSTAESLVWELLCIAVTLLLARRFVAKKVLQPLTEMERHASRLARTEHGRLEFHSREGGEIGALAHSLDEMLHKIQADRSDFVRSARIAGMSDVSMGVVHSAGNILNSVNVSTKLLAKELSEIGITDLRAMIAELKDHQDDLATYVTEDPNGKFLLPFLFATTEALDDLQTRCLVELESVEHGVGHVIDLIRSQEKYAIGAAVVEVTSIADVIDQALNIATLAGEDASDIFIDRSYSGIGEVQIDRHKLTSILINIISNAVEALNLSDNQDKRLELALYPMTEDRFVIEIMDTGVGIAPENLDLIFTTSFSTKEDSSGQGLHTTANLCKELGIATGTVSEGENCGSVFKLRVPYTPPHVAATEGDDAAAALPGVETPAAALPADGSAAEPSAGAADEPSWSSHSERGDLYRDDPYGGQKPY